jgi:hypothetical protein
MPQRKRERSTCGCGRETARTGQRYFSVNCLRDHQYREYISRWKRGEEHGLRSGVLTSRYMKRYLREKYGDKCTRCGWSEVNPHTGLVPLEVEHKDGDWRNNSEENLDLLCPNCHALTPTYRALNRGKGRRVAGAM